MELNRKSKPRYLGPMIVVKRTENGAYVVAEIDGAVSKSNYAAFRLVPYRARRSCTGPIPVLDDQSREEEPRDSGTSLEDSPPPDSGTDDEEDDVDDREDDG
jgi:hypothetical protein